MFVLIHYLMFIQLLVIIRVILILSINNNSLKSIFTLRVWWNW